MTLSEKIIKGLRMYKDGGLSTDHLYSIIADSPAKVDAALQTLQEQERVIKGSDGCWYLGDSEVSGATLSVKPVHETLIDLIARKPEPQPPIIPTPSAEIAEPALKPSSSAVFRPIGFIPATEKLVAWIEAQPDDAPPISWAELGNQLDVKRSALGKARKSLVDKKQTALVEKLDRCAQRQNSLAKKARSIEQCAVSNVQKKPPTKPQQVPASKLKLESVSNDLSEIARRLRVMELPGQWREHRTTLLELDTFFAETMGWPADRPTRVALREVSEWLEKAGRGT
jgi:hypothetical protein